MYCVRQYIGESELQHLCVSSACVVLSIRLGNVCTLSRCVAHAVLEITHTGDSLVAVRCELSVQYLMYTMQAVADGVFALLTVASILTSTHVQVCSLIQLLTVVHTRSYTANIFNNNNNRG
jgi:hypothetical protein